MKRDRIELAVVGAALLLGLGLGLLDAKLLIPALLVVGVLGAAFVRPDWGLLALAASLPWYQLTAVPMVERVPLTAFDVTGLTLAVAVVGRKLLHARAYPITMHVTGLLLVALTAWNLTSACILLPISAALLSIKPYISVLVFYWLVYILADSPKVILSALGFFAVGTVLAQLTGLTELAGGINLTRLRAPEAITLATAGGVDQVTGYVRVAGLSGDPNFFAMTGLSALPIAAIFWLRESVPWKRWALLGMMACLALSVVAGASRGVILATLMSAIVFIAGGPRKYRARLAVFMTLALTMSFLVMPHAYLTRLLSYRRRLYAVAHGARAGRPQVHRRIPRLRKGPRVAAVRAPPGHLPIHPQYVPANRGGERPTRAGAVPPPERRGFAHRAPRPPERRPRSRYGKRFLGTPDGTGWVPCILPLFQLLWRQDILVLVRLGGGRFAARSRARSGRLRKHVLQRRQIGRWPMADFRTQSDALTILSIGWRHRYFILAITACIFLATLAVVEVKPPIYKATAYLLAPPAVNPVPIKEVESLLLSDVIQATRGRSSMTQQAILESPFLQRQARNSMPPEYVAYFPDVENLPVAITNQAGTEVVTVEVRSKSREAAAALADAIVDKGLEVVHSSNENATNTGRRSLEEEIARTQRESDAAYRRMQEIRAQYQLTDLPAEVDKTTAQLVDLQFRRVDLQVQLNTVRAENATTRKLEAAEPAMIDSSTTTIRSPLLKSLLDRQADLEVELKGLLTEYTHKDPRVVDLEAQLREVKQHIAAERPNIPDSAGESVNPLRADLLTRISHLNTEEAENRGRPQRCGRPDSLLSAPARPPAASVPGMGAAVGGLWRRAKEL